MFVGFYKLIGINKFLLVSPAWLGVSPGSFADPFELRSIGKSQPDLASISRSAAVGCKNYGLAVRICEMRLW